MNGDKSMEEIKKPARTLSPQELKMLRSKARLLEPMLRLGKNGLTDSVIEHVRRLVVKQKLVKIKLLRSFLEENDRKKSAEKLAEGTGSELVDQVGFVVVLYKR